MSSEFDSEYKTPSDHNITDTEESDVKPSKRKRKEISKRIQAKKKGTQVAGNSEVQVIEDVDCFETRCRPYHLYTLIHQFSEDQMKSVKEIGFDGLLHLKVTNTVTKMLSWLVNRFDQSSRYFELSPGVGFVLTPYDVHDVFGLPFKKLFVLHAFSSFLAPHRKRFVDMRLAKVVSNVDQIRTYDWCSYVIDRFCEADKAYKQGNLQFHCGCLILLELVYFHRLRFRDVGEPTTLPLIQHWTDEKIKIRIKGEKEAKRFGLGILDTVTYPISKKLKFVDGFAVNDESEKLLDGNLFTNKDFLKFADKLCQLYWKDKTASGNFDANYEARIANLTARANEVIGDVLIDINETEFAPTVPSNPPPSEPPLSPPAEASTIPLSPSPVVQFEQGEREVNEEYVVLDDGKSLISSILTDGTAGCSLPLGDRGVEVLLVSHFMKQFKKEMRNLHKLQQEVVDYVLVEDDLCCDDEEIVVTLGLSTAFQGMQSRIWECYKRIKWFPQLLSIVGH